MKVLIVYASNSGATYLTAKRISDSLKDGNKVTLKKASEALVKDFEDADLVLIGSTSWKVEGKEGQPHETIFELMEKLKDKDFSDRNFALFGCGDRSFLHFCGAVDELESFVNKIKGKKIAESLKIDAFYYNQDARLGEIDAWAGSLAGKMPVSSIV